MAKGRPVEKSGNPRGPKIPFNGFRLVFGLANGALWFLIAGGVLAGITAGVQASGRMTPNAAVTMAATVAFFVCFFGLPGALGGFLAQAKAGRIELPPVVTWGRGALGTIHPMAAFRGVISAALVALLSSWYLGHHALPARNALSILVGAEAAVLAAIHCALLAGRRALGDIKPPASTVTAPDRRYYLTRFALPQGLGNGFITGLVALGTFPPPGVPMPTNTIVMGSLATALLIGLFTLLTGGALANLDRTFGRVSGIAGPPMSWRRRLQVLVAITAVGAAIAFLIGKTAGPGGAPIALVAIWQGLLGAISGGACAVVAARATLARATA